MAQYEKVFTKPYEDGYVDLPNQTTPITAETLNDKDAAIEHIENFLDGHEFPTALADLSDDETHRLVTDTEIAEWNNKIDSTAVEEQTTTTGQFTTKTGGKLESCIVAFNPVQSGSGDPSPSNVRPITGHSSVEVWEHGKNMFNSSNVIDGYIGTNPNTIRSLASARLIYAPCKANTKYTVSKKAGSRFVVGYTTETPNANVTVYGSTTDYTATSITITTDATAKYIVAFVWLESTDTVTSDVMLNSCQIEVGLTATTYEPYQGQDVTVALGGTYYGGTLDVVSGVFTGIVKKKVFDGTETWNDFASSGSISYTINDMKAGLATELNPESMCSSMEISDTYVQGKCMFGGTSNRYKSFWILGATGMGLDTKAKVQAYTTGMQIVYLLDNPITIQLTPQQINTLIGENNIDVPMTGQSLTSAVYRELFAWSDVEDVVELRLPISAIGTDESNNDTASQAYSQGDYFYKNGIAKAKTSIASGATFTLGTNYEIKTLAEILQALES